VHFYRVAQSAQPHCPDISFPSSTYQEELEAYDRTRKYSGIDPYHWWTRLQKHLPYHVGRTTDGPHGAIATTGYYRDELLDALFDFESTWPENLPQTLPLRELEHTYGYKLHRIKDASGRFRPGTELIIEVGRFFQDLSRDIKQYSSISCASDAIKQAYTMSKLHERCKQPDVDPQSTGDPTKEARDRLGRIWTVLRCLNHVAVLPEQLPQSVDECLDKFILDLIDESYIRGATPQNPQLPNVDDALHFSPKELCFKTLTDLGGLKIAWTHLYSQHLRLVRSSKTLLLFWDVSILGQSPLFTHWPQWMNQDPNSDHEKLTSVSAYSTMPKGLLGELQRSYRIIFGNPDGRFLDRFFRKHFHRSSSDDVGIVLHDLESIMLGAPRVRINVKRSSARQALKYYLRASIPPSILSLRPELDRKRHRGPNRRHNWHFLHNYNPFFFSLRRPTAGKLSDLLNAGPPYPLDFWMHISYLLELSRSTSLDEMERYSSYPIFGQRLRELQKYMEKQKPRNLRQLWKDRRDTVGYWAFWAVIVVGGLSVLLSLISIAISSAQAVAGFQALGQQYHNSSS